MRGVSPAGMRWHSQYTHSSENPKLAFPHLFDSGTGVACWMCCRSIPAKWSRRVLDWGDLRRRLLTLVVSEGGEDKGWAPLGQRRRGRSCSEGLTPVGVHFTGRLCCDAQPKWNLGPKCQVQIPPLPPAGPVAEGKCITISFSVFSSAKRR